MLKVDDGPDQRHWRRRLELRRETFASQAWTTEPPTHRTCNTSNWDAESRAKMKLIWAQNWFQWKSVRKGHRYLKKLTAHWPYPPSLITALVILTTALRIHTGAVWGVSVLICHACNVMGCMLRPVCQLQPMSSLFLLHVYGSFTHVKSIKCKKF